MGEDAREAAAMFGFGRKNKQKQDAEAQAVPVEGQAEGKVEAQTADVKAEAPAAEASAKAAPAAADAAPQVERLAPPPAPEGVFHAGLMQSRPINLASILEFAAKYHAKQEVVTALIEGGMHRQTYAQTLARTKQLANAIRRMGIGASDRVATMAWNTHRHFEAWYAISGQGAVCHTVNPRLSVEQAVYIINHAGGRILFVDLTFVPLVEAIRSQLTKVEKYVVMTDRAHMPEGDHWLCYEDLIAVEEPEFDWPSFPEETASSLCYTSGTTGEPKGVLYTHRSNLLMAYGAGGKDGMNMGASSTALMVVPMFHANAWGLVYGGPMVGAKLVLPGASLDGASVHRMIKDEKVTNSAAVPTVWNMLLAHLEKTGEDLTPLTEVVIGGSAVPRSMIEAFDQKFGIEVIQGWGMTEMSPLGTINRRLPQHAHLTGEAKYDVAVKQGRPIYGVELRIVDADGAELPWDGKAAGTLMVRGPWVVQSYFGRDEVLVDADGWFDTGDMATIDEDGMMAITDRAKDVIKSGGEWISSVDLENAAMGAPGVQLACAIGVRHPKWEERPILLVVPKEGETPDPEVIKAHIAKTFATWQLPDDIIFVEELPMTATGKFDKKVVRAKYIDHLMQKAAE